MDMKHLRKLVRTIDTSKVGSLEWISSHRDLMVLVREELARLPDGNCPNSSWGCRDPHCVEHRGAKAVPFDAPDPRD